MSENDNIISLIAKQLQGMATAEEKEQLQLWLKANPAHQQQYDEMAVIWQKSGPLLAEPHFSAEAAWLKLDEKISPVRKMHYDSVISFMFTAKRIAVAVVLITVMALAGYWWHSHSQWQSITATNNNQSITLPDHSVVLLRKGSTLDFPSTFNKKQRLVQLTGEAFFKVQHNESQPFLIATVNSEVKVLGTSFLVNSTKAEDEVVVVTGRVNVQDKNRNNNAVILTPGQRVVLQNDHFYQNEVTDSNFLAWQTGLLNFKNTSFHKVLQDLSNYYDVPVIVDAADEAATQELTITVRFENQPLEQALEEIRLITGLNTKKAADKIIFCRK